MCRWGAQSPSMHQCTMAQALKKFGIKDFAKMMTLAPILSSQNYFRWKYLDDISFVVSLLILIWGRVENSLLQLKYTNIFQIFSQPESSEIFGFDFLMALFNWSPQICSHPFRNLFDLQLILWQFDCSRRLFSTRPQIRIESETAKEITSKYFHLK